ncbi:hypothetical protein SAMN05421820_102565 [Pedobacter steynii]|uniref:Uncharacterized protein n=1 Tax=Pedobacter steynii TaxID=430522 RepID=A0A1G9P6N9_9SPHI|nr:hypothetical protein SAMN05421820_102565 [Pedobacter steynii]
MLQHVQEAGVVMPAVAAGIVNTVMLVVPAVYVPQELVLLVKMYRPPGQPSKAVIRALRNARAPQKKEQGANGLSEVVDIVGSINRTKFYYFYLLSDY